MKGPFRTDSVLKGPPFMTGGTYCLLTAVGSTTYTTRY